MRRKDYQVYDMEKIIEILEKCDICRLAMNDKSGIFLVPMSFGYTMEDEKLTLYFHGAMAGRRYEALTATQDPHVAFEMDCDHELIVEEDTYKYSSIIGEGTVKVIEDFSEKEACIDVLMDCMSHIKKKFPESLVKNTFIFKVEADYYTAKANRKAQG